MSLSDSSLNFRLSLISFFEYINDRYDIYWCVKDKEPVELILCLWFQQFVISSLAFLFSLLPFCFDLCPLAFDDSVTDCLANKSHLVISSNSILKGWVNTFLCQITGLCAFAHLLLNNKHNLITTTAATTVDKDPALFVTHPYHINSNNKQNANQNSLWYLSMKKIVKQSRETMNLSKIVYKAS